MKLLQVNFNHGLSERSLEILQSILSAYPITEVKVFGSRATGNYKEYSDLDLIIHGDLKPSDEDRLWTLFSEASLPIKVDVKLYNEIKYKLLKEHIDKEAKLLFRAIPE